MFSVREQEGLLREGNTGVVARTRKTCAAQCLARRGLGQQRGLGEGLAWD